MRGELLLAAVLVASLLVASAYSTSSTEKPEPQALVYLGSFEWCADIYCGKTASVGQTVQWFADTWGYGLFGALL
ncbi:MAG: hypothetical protein JZD41_09500 [Thermoproteus sp.]|nr:hypothetical protein [Thermoproteus sp.]